ncbi:MAG TPA: ZIP family metal transporter [Patescibacteria group bacterium]|nr:ZIP family metal transporter [Patescibacteria group bacterium]
MPNNYDVLIFTLIGSIVSLVGGFLLISRKKTALGLAKYATPFAAGGLLAAVFIDLLPEGIKTAKPETVFTSTMIGLIVFFFLERFLRWFHHHHEHVGDEDKKQTSIPLIITGNTLHNALDGVAIASAFLINFQAGAVTTIAVAAHEIPREIGDFGLLLAKKMSRRGVIWVHIFSSLATILAALLAFNLGGLGDLPIGVLLGLSAGFMLYIASSDIIPTIHEETRDDNLLDIRPFLLLVGAVVVGLAIIIAKHFGG